MLSMWSGGEVRQGRVDENGGQGTGEGPAENEVFIGDKLFGSYAFCELELGGVDVRKLGGDIFFYQRSYPPP